MARNMWMKDQILAALPAIPYAEQISQVTTTEEDAVRFVWRGDTFRFSTGGLCEVVTGKFLSGGNMAILMERVLVSAMSSNLQRNLAQ